ncbi:MAG TPA: HlyD family secretion protein [Candidatus Methylacidiphilales bacterium]|nr:HlyD family secretion protein [Candidatus Methylacidiphilales bacterium]
MKRYIRSGVLIVLAVLFGWVIWYHYQLAPWTRDGRVRVQVANVASEISGKIVDIKVRDNQHVKIGDPLFVIFQDDYRFALQQAEAQVEEANADMEIQKLDAARREKLGSSIVSAEDIQTYSSTAVRARAAYTAAVAARDLAKLNLDRTVIYSPVNGYVTNLQMRIGDYAHPGETKLSIVDEDSFWVSAYFEETKIPRIHMGDTARIKLMGVGPELEGRVNSISRGIADRNTSGGSQSLPDVDPIFTWVRLAQRIPVRIEIVHVPDGVVLAAGQTCTVVVKDK